MKSTLARSWLHLWLVAGLGAAGVLGCGEDGAATGSSCPTTQTLAYESFGQEFMSKHCLACHSASGPESPKFDTLEQVQANLSAIDKAAAAGPDAVNPSMPEGGSVDEAEQVSLGRRVALKVLPFAAVLDGKQLDRFHREARAAAMLHHTNIVPVFAVGCERGVHFYAMQFIDGKDLQHVVDGLRARPVKHRDAVLRGRAYFRTVARLSRSA